MPTTPPQPYDSTDFDSPTVGNVLQTLPGQFDFSNIIISPTSVVGATKGLAYTQQISIINGYAPYGNLIISAGNLPANLSLSITTNDFVNNVATANITGIPTTIETANFTIQGNDVITGTTFTATQEYSIEVVPPTITITPSSLTDAVVGQTYTQAFTANGGGAPYTYSNVGNLPPSLTLTSTGSLTGTITSNATPANFTIVATDSYSSTGNIDYSLTVVQPTVTVTPSTLSNGIVGTAYTATISATGGNTPYTFDVTSGSLPANLVLNTATGNITGTPTANATSTFSVTAYDYYGSPGTQSYTVETTRPTVAVSANIPNGVVGTPYSTTITATGGVAPYSWYGGVHIPPGLSLTGATAVGNVGTVQLTGTPTNYGTSYQLDLVATDAYGTEGTATYLNVIIDYPVITVSPTSIANATTGAYYSATITATGGVAPYHYSVTGNTLPPNLTLGNTTGIISGIIIDNTDSPFNFGITAYDSYESPGSRNYSITVTDPTIAVRPRLIPNGVVGVSYEQLFTSTGGTGPYTYSVTGGTLPGNLTLATSGSLTGTPTTAGNSTFTVTSSDAYASEGSFTYDVSMSLPHITLDPPSLPSIIVGNVYDARVTAFGGTDPYTFEVTSGNLPVGVSLASDGNITGMTSVTSNSSFIITATDSYDTTGTRSYSILVEPPTITISPATLPNGIANIAYSVTLTAAGGTAPYTFEAGSDLPDGLSFDADTGVISGVPTVIGWQPFTIIATDDNGYSGEYVYNFVVVPDVPESAIEVYVGGIRQTSGYTVTSKSPATIEFDVPPPANVAVTLAVRQGVSWYEPGLYSATDGVPLQEADTPAARFLRGQ